MSLIFVGGLKQSTIVGNDANYLQYLSTWLKPVAQSKSSRWKRCWRASVDGWAASTFHSGCDNKGPTVTIIILGDPGADSGDEGKSKRAEKCGAKKSKERREEPLGTMS